jgi:hypothetical protein
MAVPVGGECSPEGGERGVAADVDDQVVVVDSVGDVVLCVVDDPISTETSYQVEFPGAGDAGDVGSGGLGQLHRVAADAAGGTDDQHSLSWL